MPKIGVTVYDLLLSCPGDVEYLKPIIEDCIKRFNGSIGQINNVRIELKHWTTDGFSQSGNKPQELLNKQFINECDLCVALLGTRFGTPTDNYDSGTEEEIETMLSQNKQVFLYFIEREIDPSSIDIEQYRKVRVFKEKYLDKGIYTTIKNDEDLGKEFFNALSLYFIKLSSPHAVNEVKNILTPNIVIGTERGVCDEIELEHTKFCDVKLVYDKENRIRELINHIEKIKLETTQDDIVAPIISDEQVKRMKTGEVLDALKNGTTTQLQLDRVFGNYAPTYSKVEISEYKKKVILAFCESNEINLSSNFWSLGNLQQENASAFFSLAHNDSLKGSDSEKQKYELINEVVGLIQNYNDVYQFFSSLDKLCNTSLIVENIGTTFDEDIDIRVFIDKGHLIIPQNLPVPGNHFIDEINEINAPKVLFAGYHGHDIDEFSSYPMAPPDFSYFPSPFTNSSEELKKSREKYSESVKRVFCYEYFETDEEDVLSFNIPYLKQNTKMFFPSFLFFNSTPSYIRYEIRAKHSPNVYEKRINIKK